jgi:hypothetical protein
MMCHMIYEKIFCVKQYFQDGKNFSLSRQKNGSGAERFDIFDKTGVGFIDTFYIFNFDTDF